LPPRWVKFIGQSLQTVDAPRAQHDARALRGKMACGGLTEAAACARDDDDFSFDIVAHDRLLRKW
jgi:hypothetical protein